MTFVYFLLCTSQVIQYMAAVKCMGGVFRQTFPLDDFNLDRAGVKLYHCM